MRCLLPLVTLVWLIALGAEAQLSPPAPSSRATRGDELLADYLRRETASVADECLAEIQTAEDWQEQRPQYRRQLQEMLGLWPMPKRSELKPVITGRLDQEAFTVEKLHFQASPGLYCTANLYLPKGLTEPTPTILYRCGHWKLVTNGISYGNKAVYQIDGAWFARNGYICLVLDTLLAGEVQGIHTGTRDHGLWWWNSRGYTPAGVEVWFGIRALDYLCTRPEVDTNRFGITGHSGGGAYSWTLTALDDRIQVAAPLAGMTDLKHHILDNLMDSHCDCNFFINYYRWDFPQLAALAAPRPLLIGGTDNDRLFPLDGTVGIHDKVKGIYGLLNASDNLGLAIAPGPHDEVPELRLAVMHWFNRHLRGLDKRSEPPVLVEAERFFAPEELRVFQELPRDAINTNIAEGFVPLAKAQRRSAEELGRVLREEVFAGWPDEPRPVQPTDRFSVESEDVRFRAFNFISQEDVPLRLYLLESTTVREPGAIELRVLQERGWTNWLATISSVFGSELVEENSGVGSIRPDPEAWDRLKQRLDEGPGALAFVAPRGMGFTAWSGDPKRNTRIRRRFMLLGQTVDGMRVWDIRRTIQALRAVRSDDSLKVNLRAEGAMAVSVLYAALFEPGIDRLLLAGLPELQIDGPDYLGVLRVTDIPEVRAAVSARTTISADP